MASKLKLGKRLPDSAPVDEVASNIKLGNLLVLSKDVARLEIPSFVMFTESLSAEELTSDEMEGNKCSCVEFAVVGNGGVGEVDAEDVAELRFSILPEMDLMD